MPTVTWERGLMRVWLVVTIVLAIPILMWIATATFFVRTPDSPAVIGLLLLLLAAQQLASYGVARLIVWMVRGFIGQRHAAPPAP